ncbi:MAG: ATP-binding cassette domain-containing protein [Chloroflexota bacterium]
MSTLVSIHDLYLRRENQVVLEIEHLAIERGQVTALVGPNGAGKTTLLLALARLLKPERGQILFDGKPLGEIPDLQYRRQVGLVMQDSLLLDRSVFDNIAVGLRFRGMPGPETRRRVNEWLDRLNISHLRARRATRLSGGEAQRVCLARALVLQPVLLLLDEPFKSLDETAHAGLLADMKTLLPQIHTTTVFAAHSTKDVRELANDKIALRSGRISN